MNKEEAKYWRSFIYRVIEEKLPTIETTDADAIRIKEFVDHHMSTITGQQMLPQRVFRDFVEIFSHIPALQAAIQEAQEDIQKAIEHLDQTTFEYVEEEEKMYIHQVKPVTE